MGRRAAYRRGARFTPEDFVEVIFAKKFAGVASGDGDVGVDFEVRRERLPAFKGLRDAFARHARFVKRKVLEEFRGKDVSP